MSTVDNLTLLLFTDLVSRRIIPNRKTLKSWMESKNDPFPKPIVLVEGKQQPNSKRFGGRRVAWRAVDVEQWLDRKAKQGE